jgi:hypothetical protein
MGVRDVEEDVDACLSVVMLPLELPERSEGLLFPNGEPTGVSSGEKRSAAQIKFDDSTVLKRQFEHSIATERRTKRQSLLLPTLLPILDDLALCHLLSADILLSVNEQSDSGQVVFDLFRFYVFHE